MKRSDLDWERVQTYPEREPTKEEQSQPATIQQWGGDNLLCFGGPYGDSIPVHSVMSPEGDQWLVWERQDGALFRVLQATAAELEQERSESQREHDETVARVAAYIAQVGPLKAAKHLVDEFGVWV